MKTLQAYADALRANAVRNEYGGDVPPDPWPNVPPPVLDAAYDLVEAMMPYATSPGWSFVVPVWNGWAIRYAYLAGVRAARELDR